MLERAGRGVCFRRVSEKAPLLMLGLPKGSLEESTKNLFAKAGWKITTSSRSYRPSIDDAELDGRFIRAQEVSRYVEHGFFDCGLTGIVRRQSLLAAYQFSPREGRSRWRKVRH